MIENSPLSPAFAEAFCPFGRVTSTVEPASAVPVMAVAPALTAFTVGATGGVVSGTVTDVAPDLLPAASVAVTDTVLPSSNPLTGTLKFPSWSAFADTVEPFGRVTSTVEPGSAVPVTAVEAAVTGFTFGAAGGVVSAGFASTLISFQPTGLVYLSSLMFETTLALPGWICSFISRTIVSKKPSVEYDLTTAFDSSFEVHAPGIESRLIATTLLALPALG